MNKKDFHNRLIQSHIRDIILLILAETDSEALSLFVTNLIKNITRYNQIPKV
jgi:recombinational DNA repair protein RecR